MESGTKLGHYEVTDLLGKGGMGEVYRARDTKLGREVAIKVLPSEFSQDTERLARLEREARMLAALNHPNIAAIYGLEQSDDMRFLILELVEGDTLADRLKGGAIPVEESLKLALQIAEALEAAHEKGVIHRDLKPANIKITPEGRVKVLDFGLAKAFIGDQADVNLSNSPTLSMAATQAGVILGTAAYMSPEQASGAETDKRADIWSFGVVLFEMLSGCPVFTGETVSHILADVLKSEPDWDSLPANLHPRLRFLLERCLTKESGVRCQGIAEARAEIQKALGDTGGVIFESGVDSALAPSGSKLVWIAALVLAVIAGVASWILKPPEPGPIVRFDETLPEGRAFRDNSRNFLAIASDGSKFVYTAEEGLFLRTMGQRGAQLIAGTEGTVSSPTFSPDGEWLAYWSASEQQLLKITVAGGTPVPLTELVVAPFGISWDVDNTIMYSTASGLLKMSSDGGEPEIVAESGRGYPQFIAEANAVLYGTATQQIGVQSLDSGESMTLFSGSRPRYLPTGHIVYGVDDALYAVPFDLASMEVAGGSVPLVQGLWTGPLQYAVSDSGTLVYAPGIDGSAALQTLVLVDEGGNAEPFIDTPRDYTQPRLSPDGRRIAVSVRDDAGASRPWHVWVIETEDQDANQLTFDGTNNRSPIWSSDGLTIVYQTGTFGNLGNLGTKAADGSGITEIVMQSEYTLAATDSLPDGTIVFQEARPGGRAIGTLQLNGNGSVTEFLSNPGVNERMAIFSPNGQALAYVSSESGQDEVWVRPYPRTEGSQTLVSTGGGLMPIWSRESDELYYFNPSSGMLMAQPLQMSPNFRRSGAPRELFEISTRFKLDIPELSLAYDVAPDGRFVFVQPVEETASGERPVSQVVVVLNWFQELRERVPVN